MPFLVLWELTRACALSCRHCRANAQIERSREELSETEALRVLHQLRAFHPTFPLVIVFTGGDPLARPDLFELVREAAVLGFRPTVTPSGTRSVTTTHLIDLQRAGLARLAVSLDAATPERHDAFRGEQGSFAESLRILKTAKDLGIESQVNSTMTADTVKDFDGLAALCETLGVSLWSVFFLVQTGRGRGQEMLSADETEAVFKKMAKLQQTSSFDIKSTAAPHYRRVLLQDGKIRGSQRIPGLDLGGESQPMRSAQGVNDGSGLLFISHTGEVYPSGFLPVSAGNVRRESIVELYRYAPLFQALRNVDALEGKCGACEYRRVCGGSRARAFATTGQLMESDPSCAYVPRGWNAATTEGQQP